MTPSRQKLGLFQLNKLVYKRFIWIEWSIFFAHISKTFQPVGTENAFFDWLDFVKNFLYFEIFSGHGWILICQILKLPILWSAESTILSWNGERKLTISCSTKLQIFGTGIEKPLLKNFQFLIARSIQSICCCCYSRLKNFAWK